MMENVFGVDVAKDWIDVVGPDGHERVNNDDLTAFALRVGNEGGRVAFEASGGYETPLRTALGTAGVPAIRINPRRARAFATSPGRLAKTDRVDAGVIREMARRLEFVGRFDGTALDVPLLQADYAEACGISPIHANRTFRLLRERGLIANREDRQGLTILDREALARLGEFDGDYLYGEGQLELADPYCTLNIYQHEWREREGRSWRPSLDVHSSCFPPSGAPPPSP